jgi:hypothetical protein
MPQRGERRKRKAAGLIDLVIFLAVLLPVSEAAKALKRKDVGRPRGSG